MSDFRIFIPNASVDASHERFVVDHNRCILCTRCVRVCDEIEGAHTWDVMGRGTNSRVITDLNQPWGTSDTCTSCGKCVQVCPTGALFEKGKSVAEMAKRREFLPYLTTMRGQRQMKKLRLATVWLDGCSGCHMSFLDMDERLIELAALVDLVYSPLVDTKEFPENVDVVAGRRSGQQRRRFGKNPENPATGRNSRFAGRLRRHRKRSQHAQSVSCRGG